MVKQDDGHYDRRIPQNDLKRRIGNPQQSLTHKIRKKHTQRASREHDEQYLTDSPLLFPIISFKTLQTFVFLKHKNLQKSKNPNPSPEKDHR